MSAAPETRLFPSAIPLGEAEQAQWDALTDEERSQLYDEMFESPDCNTYIEENMDEILAAAKARLAARRG